MSINVEELIDRKTDEVFPNILVLTPNQTLPVIVRDLEEGDMQLVMEMNGKRKTILSISRSAFNIDKLLRTSGRLLLRLSPTEQYEVKTIAEYLECICK